MDMIVYFLYPVHDYSLCQSGLIAFNLHLKIHLLILISYYYYFFSGPLNIVYLILIKKNNNLIFIKLIHFNKKNKKI